jgi:branched-chain amino acid transport system substrate-binding protein
VVQNVHIARADEKHGFTVIGEEKSVPPSYEQTVCDLVARPNTAKQFTPSAKAN